MTIFLLLFYILHFTNFATSNYTTNYTSKLAIPSNIDITSFLTDSPIIIDLTPQNILILKDTINEDSASDLILNINNKKNKKNLMLYLDTNGGSVEQGMKIISEVKKNNISCIAETAYSMGFSIFQNCYTRYILPHGKLMQHQISFAIKGEKGKIDSYVQFVDSMHKIMIKQQSRRLRLPRRKFETKILNEWWIFGQYAIEENAADYIVEIKCDNILSNSVYNVTKNGYIYTYSSCPLISKEIHKVKDPNYIEEFSFLFR
jgi:ATP-dependent protease ClpP protease subunit